jgi:putative DNA primase/helicase
MIETPEDPFRPLVELARIPGSGRLELLDKPNIALAAKLRNTDLKRFAALEGMLHRWVALASWKEAVRKRLAIGKKRTAEEEELEKAEERIAAAEEAGRPVVDAAHPLKIARAFMEAKAPHVMWLDGGWLNWNGNHYAPVEAKGMRAMVQAWLEGAVDAATGNPMRVTRHGIDDVLDAIGNIAFREIGSTKSPTWLTPMEDDPEPQSVITAANGILDVRTGKLAPCTPRFFTLNAIGFDYEDPAFVARPWVWHEFLESIWPDAEGGAENKAALQEVFGHLLTGDMRYQKIFYLHGAARSGKGTILRVLTQLIGEGNCAEQSINKLGETFGLKALLGKQLLAVADLRLGKNANVGAITETLLNISGQDRVSVGRKFQDDVNERLNTRIILVSNHVLTFPDQSGALAMRYIPLVFTKSFNGREDLTLGDKLQAELPGILLWALEGLRRLEARGHFELTAGGKAFLRKVRKHSSPIKEFLGERCDLGGARTVLKEDLFDAFEQWCEDNDVSSRYGAVSSFARDLPDSITSVRPGGGHERPQFFKGISLRPEHQTTAP